MAKKMYIGVDGKARKVKKIYNGVAGVARKVKKGYIGVDGVAREFFTSRNSVIGQQWIFTEDGTFTVPDDGTYTIEMHGGGGGGGGAVRYHIRQSAIMPDKLKYLRTANGGNGGGSGEIYTTTLKEGETYDITIGTGGTRGANTDRDSYTGTATGKKGGDGGTTTFGSLYSVAGGKGGTGASITTAPKVTEGTDGASSGSLASGSDGGSTVETGYGDGGAAGRVDSESITGGVSTTMVNSKAGTKGAVIITFLG